MFSRRTQWKMNPNRLSTAIAEARTYGRGILDLTISNPTRAGIVYDRAAIMDSLGSERVLDYDPQPKGLLPAREAVAKYYVERGEAVDAEHLFLTSGTSEGYSYLFRLLANPEDEILIPAPSYPLFEFLADLEDVRLVSYPLLYDHSWQMDFHSLTSAITQRSRAIVLLNPNNPTGSYVHPKERETLNEICQQHRLALIVDEVFLDYSHDRQRRPTFALNPNILTFTLSGLSKICALPQMKLAWTVASGPESDRIEAEQRLEVIADSYLSVATPVQWAAASFLAQREDIQQQLLRRISVNRLELDRQLDSPRACTRLTVEGGWYAILRVPVTQSDEELTIQLLQQTGALVHPGHFYDFPADGYLVISLIAPEAEFREGISRLLEFLG